MILDWFCTSSGQFFLYNIIMIIMMIIAILYFPLPIWYSWMLQILRIIDKQSNNKQNWLRNWKKTTPKNKLYFPYLKVSLKKWCLKWCNIRRTFHVYYTWKFQTIKRGNLSFIFSARSSCPYTTDPKIYQNYTHFEYKFVHCEKGRIKFNPKADSSEKKLNLFKILFLFTV